ncbi:alpha-2,8-sialyltransferase 8F-like isoform X2 [Hyperolius riggenbachi]|uniref:alpha-2,8-sialyltransferase 8F-like isoform X2 n=1 Tax=Hyperolius riggenbachi TaxID=752182 RepID=UPI0035A30748
MRHRWIFFYFSALVLHGFNTNLQNRMTKHFCIAPDDFRKHVNNIQACPWQYNRTEDNALKQEFKKCCNTSHMLLVSQDNTPLGHNLRYEVSQNKAVKVTESIHRMLPESSPFKGKQFKTCAVVGNGGILRNSLCGREIDNTDFVFRLNLAPLNSPEDVGTNCDLVTANPSILVSRFERLIERRKPFVDLVRSFGSAMIVMPAFSYVRNKDISFRVLHAMEDFSLKNKVVFFHPDYLRNLYKHWRKKGLQAKRLSSGMMLVSAAIELCHSVTLYGFWPFSLDLDGNLLTHHYYDDKHPSPGFHAMPEEFYFYTKMHLKGALYLHIGKC